MVGLLLGVLGVLLGVLGALLGLVEGTVSVFLGGRGLALCFFMSCVHVPILAYVDSGYRNETASKNMGSTFFLEKLAFHVC